MKKMLPRGVPLYVTIVTLLLLCATDGTRAQAEAGRAGGQGAAPLPAGQTQERPSPSPTPPPNPSAATNDPLAMVQEVTSLTQQVVKLYREGNYNDAVPLAERALALAEKGAAAGVPPEFSDVMIAGSSNVLGQLYTARGEYDRAEPLYLRAIQLNEKRQGAEHPILAINFGNLAALYFEKGDYDRAAPLFERSLAILEKVRGPEHPDVATALNNLAQVYDAKNDYARVEELLTRSLAIREKSQGPEHPDVAVSLNNLASLYATKGDAERAEQFYRRALAIREKVGGPEHPEVARLLNNLAVLYKRAGEYLKAEPLYQRALAITEKAYGPEHRMVADILDNMAQLLVGKGDEARAVGLYRRALAIREKVLGAEHPDVAESLNNLAELYKTRGDYGQAEPLFARALAIFEKKVGAEHRLTATALDNLASLYHARREYDRAEPLLQRALEIRKKVFGGESIEVAVSLNNVGGLYFAEGDFARAESLHRQSLNVYEKLMGPNHPTIATILNNLSTDYYARGDAAQAIRAQDRSNEINERHLALLLTAGSEEQKRLYMATLASDNDYTTTLHARLAPDSPEALRLALTTVIRRKGRVLDAMSDQIAALRRSLKPGDQALLEQLSAVRAQLASLVRSGPGKTAPAQYQEKLAALTAEAERLETTISERSAEYRTQSQPVTLGGVQQAVPAGAALVELVLYRPFNVKSQTRQDRWFPARYVAYVLRREGAPLWVDLGEAAAVDGAVADLRAALADPKRDDVRALARAVDERVTRPLRRLLGDTRQIFLSPDGALNLIPFGAIVDEQGHYLLEAYTITYLSSGRDLLRLQAQNESKAGPVVIADPLFDGGATAASGGDAPAAVQRGGDAAAARRSADFSDPKFSRLPGTADEARAIGKIMPDVVLMTGAQATEAAIKRLGGPRLLHIATHGFFLPDVPRQNAAGDTRGLLLSGGGAERAAAPGENPLLRSGLALAGANTSKGMGGEDGVLTALEAAGLDLWGTRLVVLSACETGVGEVKNGDGVYGLRRALVLAGSESQVMSLWQVSDEATRDLMVSYYRRLTAGEGRTQALRQVQLEMLGGGASGTGGRQRGLGGPDTLPKADRRHPYFWAAFIQSGDWRPMSPQPPAAK